MTPGSGAIALLLVLAGGMALALNGLARRNRLLLAQQNRSASIIDAMPAVLVGLDPEGTITLWNRQAELTTGILAGAALGHSLALVLPPFAPWILELRTEVASTRRAATREKLLMERNGERACYDLTLYPLAAQGPQGAVVRIEDMTERMRIQELMIQTEKMRSVGGLVAGMAHEINNPLGIISQAAQNIERRLSPELPVNQNVAADIGLELPLLKAYFEQRKIPEFTASIQEAVGRATRIVANLLQFSRRTESAWVPASLADVVHQAVALAANDYDLKKQFKFRDIETQFEFEPDLPNIPMVATEVEQAVLSLLRNAAQAMVGNPPERPPRLEFRLWRQPPHLVLAVKDNGPGMDAQVRRRVFEPFFTTREPGMGSGLGLSVAYMIITEHHKGLIEVDSEPGQGARFILRLPLALDRAVRTAASGISPEGAP